jgi:hypothetical protein
MEATEAGEVTFPLNPAFFAWVNAAVNNVTGNATAYTILYNDEAYDIGSDYATGTGKWTAPVTGKYHFCSTALVSGVVSATTSQLFLLTTNRTYVGYYGGASAFKSAVGQVNLKAEIFADMDAADTAYNQINFNGEGSNVNDLLGHATVAYSYFSGRLVC